MGRKGSKFSTQFRWLHVILKIRTSQKWAEKHKREGGRREGGREGRREGGREGGREGREGGRGGREGGEREAYLSNIHNLPRLSCRHEVSLYQCGCDGGCVPQCRSGNEVVLTALLQSPPANL